MYKRLIAVLVMSVLLFCLAGAAAETYPIRRGAVNDDAAVLSDSTAADVDTLNTRSTANFTVITRHFLGGADAQQFCDGLFEAWNLKSNDVLLLLVIGEERYAATLGSDILGNSISSEQLNSIFSAKLRQSFIQDRNYDAAVGDFLLAVSSQIARAEGKTLNTSGLFGSAQTAETTTNNAGNTNSGSWYSSWSSDGWSSFFSDSDLGTAGQGDADYDYDRDSGFSIGKLILIAVVLMIIVRNRRRNGKSGLGLLGWIVAGFGAKHVINGINRGIPRGPRGPRR